MTSKYFPLSYDISVFYLGHEVHGNVNSFWEKGELGGGHAEHLLVLILSQATRGKITAVRLSLLRNKSIATSVLDGKFPSMSM